MDIFCNEKFFIVVSIIVIVYSLIRAFLGLTLGDYGVVFKAFLQGLLGVYLYYSVKKFTESNS